MGFNFAAAGYFAKGVAKGEKDAAEIEADRWVARERQHRMGLADVDQQWQNKERERQQQQWQREDQDREVWQTAQQAGGKGLMAEMQEYERTAPPAGLDGKPKPWTPSRDSILKSADTETRELLLRGRSDLGIRRWKEVEPLRASQRAQTAQDLYLAVTSGGDITEPLRKFNRTIGDGHDIDGQAKMIKRPDGSTIYEVRRRNESTGKVDEQYQVTPQQLVERAVMMLGSPEKVAEHSLQRFMEVVKTDQGIRRDAAKEKGERETKAIDHGYRLDDIDATGAQARQTKEAPGSPTSGRSEALGLLREERIAAQSEVTNLTNRLRVTHRSDRPALVVRIEEAQRRARDIGDKIGAYGDEKRGAGGAPSGGARAMDMPKARGELRAGAVYQTSRGPARWNGRAFEAQ